jgi:hypothetical protein
MKNYSYYINILFFGALFIFHACATPSFKPTFFPSDSKIQLPKAAILLNISDSRKEKEKSEEIMKNIKYSLQSNLEGTWTWVDYQDGIPEDHLFLGLEIIEMNAKFDRPNWLATSKLKISIIDRMNKGKIKKKSFIHVGHAKTFHIPGTGAKNKALKNSWDKISKDVLNSIRKSLGH